jgi:uncharacterized protein YjbI with pentapeptide repeats
MEAPATLVVSKGSNQLVTSHSSTEATGTGGGVAVYSYVDRASIHSKLICPICDQPLVEPRRTSCRHVFCLKCITNALSRQQVCPVDGKPLTMAQLSSEDILEDILADLKVYCPHGGEGRKLCEWTGVRGALADHLRTTCPAVPCPQAGRGCTYRGKQTSHVPHLQTCDYVQLKCPHQCGLELERRHLAAHTNQLNCPVMKARHEEEQRRAEEQRQKREKEEEEKRRREAQQAEEKRYAELVSECMKANPEVEDIVTVDVGGRLFKTTLTTLRKYPSSLLGMLFSPRFQLRKQSDGSVFLDRDGDAFALLLAWLRNDLVPTDLSASMARSLEAEARYWLLDQLVDALQGGGRPTQSNQNKRQSASHSGPIISQATLLQYMMISGKGQLALPGANMSGLYMAGAQLAGAILDGSCLRQANLSAANLNRGNLRKADLSGANLQQTNLTAADLRKANLSRANLTKANLTNANLGRANLEGAKLPQNLSGTNLSGVDLSGRDLTNTNLTNAKLEGARLPQNLSGTNLSGVDLSGRDLTNTDLTNTNLTNAKLEGARLPQDLSGTNLSGVDLSRRDLTNTNLTNTNLTNTNLTNANLTNANLTNANLTNANLTKANLTKANLTKANVTNTNVTKAKVEGARGLQVWSGRHLI